ncbi:aminotransferase class I and II [Kineosporia sp. J2-2]|uniref:Aminotransferase class I and II n=1 Tax=Kineosporia corallincola TaxID=2835133 RepID=A0ABS5TB38_9ACTN|nr:HipA family kinase [Kineosporia corallincola]MBT0767426.1 aminotransferase class I and II [Kineosporia corallincola]
MLRTVSATAYLTPFREGGSLPGLVEADDDGMYVVKFRGAGQGTASLVAEVVVGELSRRLGVRVPELVRITVDGRMARLEPDEEVQDLLTNSAGENLGMDYLPGSFGYDGMHWQPPAPEAATIRWIDAFAANIDRTWRNPNLLVWHRDLWAIDHGASLVFQHAWPPVERWATRRYDLSEHILAPVADTLPAAELDALDASLAARITPDLLTEVTGLVPDDWLLSMNAAIGDDRDADAWRARYQEYLLARLRERTGWRPELAEVAS